MVVASIDSFAAHDADTFETHALIGQFAKTFGRDVGSTQVDLFQEVELIGYAFGTSIVYFCTAEEVEFADVLELLQLCDAIV